MFARALQAWLRHIATGHSRIRSQTAHTITMRSICDRADAVLARHAQTLGRWRAGWQESLDFY